MTSPASHGSCVLCGEPATEIIEPLRRTLARGIDPSDPEYSVTVILPDIALCAQHSLAVDQDAQLVGWCDDDHCRNYGATGEPSGCGRPYESLGAKKRS